MSEDERVLLVMPDGEEADRLAQALASSFPFDRARDEEEAVAALWQRRYGAAIIALDLGERSGFDLVVRMRADGFDLPVLLALDAVATIDQDDLRRCECEALRCNPSDLAFLPERLRLLLRLRAAAFESRLLRDIVENTADCILMLDPVGRIRSANAAVRSVFGYDPAELPGRPLSLLLPPEKAGNDTAALLRRTLEEGQWHGSFSGRARDGREVPVALSTFVFRDGRRCPTHLVCLAHDLTERTRLIARLERLAITDELTRLYNARHFAERLGHEFRRARRYGLALSCILLDLDYFKSVNDTYGHPVGDGVLQAVARTLAANTREVDILARYGGEEFALLLPETGREGAKACAEKLRGAVGGQPVAVDGLRIGVTVSLGVASLDPDVPHDETLLKRADTALLLAKQHGRNCVVEWSEATASGPAWEENDEARLERMRERLRGISAAVRPAYLEHVKPLIEQVESLLVGARSHGARVARYAGRLGAALGLDAKAIESIRTAAFMHDLGKVALPVAIWRKPGPLTALEQALIRRHPLIGEELVAEVPVFAPERPAVRHHHERWDGQGYPDGLTGEAIPLAARLLAVANAYDALRHDRAHRNAIAKAEALAVLRAEAGKQFDPQIVEAFERMMQSEE